MTKSEINILVDFAYQMLMWDPRTRPEVSKMPESK